MTRRQRRQARHAALGALLAATVLAPAGHHPPRRPVPRRTAPPAPHREPPELADAVPLEPDLHLEPERASRGNPRTSPTPPPTSPSRSVAAAGRYLGRYRVTCYGPPTFPAGQRTANGEPVGWGSIAGDLPFGTRLILGPPVNAAGRINDRGGAVHGAHLDLWRPNCGHWPNPTVEVWTQ